LTFNLGQILDVEQVLNLEQILDLEQTLETLDLGCVYKSATGCECLRWRVVLPDTTTEKATLTRKTKGEDVLEDE
jgi:hypothetical protein